MIATTRCLKQASILRAAGHKVTVEKAPASVRCVFRYPDTPATCALLERYERKQLLPIPQKLILTAYTELVSECKNLKEGRYGAF